MAKTFGEITLKYSKELTAVSKRCSRRQEKLRQDRKTALLALETAQPALNAFQTAIADAESAREVAYAKAKTDQADTEEAARLQDYEDRSAGDVAFQAATHIQDFQDTKAEIQLTYNQTLKSINTQSMSLGDRHKARQKARDDRRKALDKAKVAFEKAKQARFDKWQKSQTVSNEKHIKAVQTARRNAEQAVKAADRKYEKAVNAANTAYLNALKTLSAVAAVEDQFSRRRQKAEENCHQQKLDVRARMKAELAEVAG